MKKLTIVLYQCLKAATFTFQKRLFFRAEIIDEARDRYWFFFWRIAWLEFLDDSGNEFITLRFVQILAVFQPQLFWNIARDKPFIRFVSLLFNERFQAGGEGAFLPDEANALCWGYPHRIPLARSVSKLAYRPGNAGYAQIRTGQRRQILKKNVLWNRFKYLTNAR